MALDKLNSEARLADTAAAYYDKLVLSKELRHGSAGSGLRLRGGRRDDAHLGRHCVCVRVNRSGRLRRAGTRSGTAWVLLGGVKLRVRVRWCECGGGWAVGRRDEEAGNERTVKG